MRRSQAGLCSENSSGRHLWIVSSTREHTSQGLTLYFCKACQMEAMEGQKGEQV